MIARPTSGEVANPAAASASISVDLPEPGPPVTTWSESVLIARPRDSAAPYPLFQRLQRLHQAPLDSGGRSEERRVGKSVPVRVDLGGRRIIKKKTEETHISRYK